MALVPCKRGDGTGLLYMRAIDSTEELLCLGSSQGLGNKVFRKGFDLDIPFLYSAPNLFMGFIKTPSISALVVSSFLRIGICSLTHFVMSVILWELSFIFRGFTWPCTHVHAMSNHNPFSISRPPPDPKIRFHQNCATFSVSLVILVSYSLSLA